MEFFKIRRTIPFMRYALVFNIISLVTFLAAVFFLATKGLNFSIEFTGGTLIEVGYSQPAEIERIRQTLDKAGYKAEVQNFGSSREVLIRMHLEKNQSSADLSQKVLQVLRTADKTAELRRVEFVGPQVGRELAEYGALALLITAVGIVAVPVDAVRVALRRFRDHRQPARRGHHPGLLRVLPVGVLAARCSPRCWRCWATR